MMNNDNKVNNQEKYLTWFANFGLHPPSNLGFHSCVKGENTKLEKVTMKVSVREERG